MKIRCVSSPLSRTQIAKRTVDAAAILPTAIQELPNFVATVREQSGASSQPSHIPSNFARFLNLAYCGNMTGAAALLLLALLSGGCATARERDTEVQAHLEREQEIRMRRKAVEDKIAEQMYQTHGNLRPVDGSTEPVHYPITR